MYLLIINYQQDEDVEDSNEQELRRLALATSARHLRLLAAQTSVPIPGHFISQNMM